MLILFFFFGWIKIIQSATVSKLFHRHPHLKCMYTADTYLFYYISSIYFFRRFPSIPLKIAWNNNKNVFDTQSLKLEIIFRNNSVQFYYVGYCSHGLPVSRLMSINTLHLGNQMLNRKFLFQDIEHYQICWFIQKVIYQCH